ncbi:hypothetical protein BJF88_04080 [Cellulosimicrobium sp. CUA-896]|nr:hypothetical protein BJF88_04080 [Cellulosimicrobium sp. CUA-896]
MREREADRRALLAVRAGLDPDAAAVVLDDALAQREADAGPSYTSFACRRWKITNTRSAYSGSIPMPLSATDSSQWVAWASTPTCTRGARSGCRNFTAFPTRFASSWCRSARSPTTTGSGSCVTVAPDDSRVSERSPSTVASACSRSTSTRSVPVRPTRENPRRSWMRRCMRLAPSTAKSMYWSARSSSWPPYLFLSSWVKLATLRSGSCRSCEAT